MSQEPHVEEETWEGEGGGGWNLHIGDVAWIAAFLWFASLFAEMLEIVRVGPVVQFLFWPLVCCVCALSHLIEVHVHQAIDDEEVVKGYWSSFLILIFFGLILLVFGLTMLG